MKTSKTRPRKSVTRKGPITHVEKKPITKEHSHTEQTPEPPQIMRPLSDEEREHKKKKK